MHCLALLDHIVQKVFWINSANGSWCGAVCCPLSLLGRSNCTLRPPETPWLLCDRVSKNMFLYHQGSLFIVSRTVAPSWSWCRWWRVQMGTFLHESQFYDIYFLWAKSSCTSGVRIAKLRQLEMLVRGIEGIGNSLHVVRMSSVRTYNLLVRMTVDGQAPIMMAMIGKSIEVASWNGRVGCSCVRQKAMAAQNQ